MSTYYRTIVTTSPDRVADLFTESGRKYLWSVYHDHYLNDEFPVAIGEADTVWGARRAARRAIKRATHVPGEPQVVSDTTWRA